MRIGISTPVVVAVPGVHSHWERSARIDDLSQIARKADELAFHHLTCSEHVAVPTAIAERRGGTYWDPLATLSYIAAHTTTIKLATLVLVLGYHHPLAIAKRYGTLDTISNGRLILGVGVGSLREEFMLVGAQFEGRGAIADESMRALRASLGETRPSFSGEYFNFDDVYVEPTAQQSHVPLWVGGSTRRSLRRAVELGDGWVPFGRTLDEFKSMLEEVTIPDGFDVALSAGKAFDPMGAPVQTREQLCAVREAGANVTSASLTANSVTHYLEQLEALANIRDQLDDHKWNQSDKHPDPTG